MAAAFSNVHQKRRYMLFLLEQFYYFLSLRARKTGLYFS